MNDHISLYHHYLPLLPPLCKNCSLEAKAKLIF